MINFEFHNPTKVILVKTQKLKPEKKSKSSVVIKCSFTLVEIIFRRMVLQIGFIKASQTLDLNMQIQTELFPTQDSVLLKKGIELCKKEGVDFILPIGGGSAIDSAKGIAYGLANDFELEDLLMGKVKTDKIAPIGCISTIAATGSETSNSMVITIEE